VHNLYVHELIKINQQDAEVKASHARLVTSAVRARRRARKASRSLAPASDLDRTGTDPTLDRTSACRSNPAGSPASGAASDDRAELRSAASSRR
jgi:hypothetical protein